MIIKNVSGSAASIPSANLIDVPNDGTVDLGAIVDGLPVLSRARTQSDLALLAGVMAGDWVAVVNGNDLTLDATLDSLSPASVIDTDGALPLTIPDTVLAKNEWVTLVEQTLAEAQGAVVKVTGGQIFFTRTGATDGSICDVIDATCVGEWETGNAGPSASKAETNIVTNESFKVESYETADAVGLRLKATRSGGTISATLRVCSTPRSL